MLGQMRQDQIFKPNKPKMFCSRKKVIQMDHYNYTVILGASFKNFIQNKNLLRNGYAIKECLIILKI